MQEISRSSLDHSKHLHTLLSQVFFKKLFDKDGDGLISAEDLRIVMQSVGKNPSDEELAAIIKEFDTDGHELSLYMHRDVDFLHYVYLHIPIILV